MCSSEAEAVVEDCEVEEVEVVTIVSHSSILTLYDPSEVEETTTCRPSSSKFISFVPPNRRFNIPPQTPYVEEDGGEAR